MVIINKVLVFVVTMTVSITVNSQDSSVVDTTFPFRLSFTRNYNTPFELSLIKKAEVSKSQRETAKKHLDRQPIEIKLPQLVKNKTPDFFRNLILNYQKGDFSAINSVPASTASLDYIANIEKHAKYSFTPYGKKKVRNHSNVYVVKTELKFEQHCGVDCSLIYHNRKTVAFNSKGQVLNVVSQFEVDRLQE